jgi:hypothetical protein
LIVCPNALPADGVALDAFEDFQLDAASACGGEHGAQVGKQANSLCMAAFGLGD